MLNFRGVVRGKFSHNDLTYQVDESIVTLRPSFRDYNRTTLIWRRPSQHCCVWYCWWFVRNPTSVEVGSFSQNITRFHKSKRWFFSTRISVAINSIAGSEIPCPSKLIRECNIPDRVHFFGTCHPTEYEPKIASNMYYIYMYIIYL